MVEVEPSRSEMENPMRTIRLEKVTVDVSVGRSGEPLEKAKRVLGQIANQKPCSKKARKTVKDFGIRKGEPIACVATLRGERGRDFLRKALEALGNKIRTSSFDEYGNFSFGIKEHIEIPGTKYVPELGIFGMNVAVTLERPGYRTKRRATRRSEVGKRHRISRENAMTFMRENFHTQIEE